MTSLTSPRLLRAVAVSACLAIGGLAGTQSPAMAATKTCKHQKTKYPQSNPGGYFTSLQVSGVSCRTGRSVMLAHYRCRVKNGRKGRCNTKVRLYTCRESRPADSQSEEQLNAKVTCRRGSSRKIVFSYQQNLR